MPTSTATATWEGVLRTGRGHFAAKSGAFAGDYTFQTRFEGATGTNPEELIAAAHAGCFSMALSAGLEKAGTPSSRIETTAQVTMDSGAIAKIRLVTRGTVPGVDAAAFRAAAEEAKKNCPVSRALAAVPVIELDAALA
ncbi:MAG TPA: OsmC family peroxiredoxin [Gemmatimonadales bacterium]|nr:OsmC family peroxiredoxin [Gemmatimonadales bacterium]